jgi:hypothetical protein
MDMAMVIVGINLCYSMVCIPLVCNMRQEKNFHPKLNQQLYPKVHLNKTLGVVPYGLEHVARGKLPLGLLLVRPRGHL